MSAARMIGGPLLAGLLPFAPGGAGASEATLAEIAARAADVLILGEHHDNTVHHLNQATLVAAIRPRALVFEMFGPRAAARATPEMRRDPALLEAALGWADLGWPDFALYYPIIAAAPDAALFGGAVPREEVRRAVTEGAVAAFGPGAALFGLDRPLDADEQAEREAGQMAAHCDALPEDKLAGMVDAQRVRDAGLARAVVAAMAEAGPPVVVITGNGHARRDWGLPRKLALALPEAVVLSVGQLEAPPGDDAPYDMWLVTEPAPRDDPCAAFR